MSMENMGPDSIWPAEDLEIAKVIIENDELLNHDPYTKRVLETGKADDGSKIASLGVFVTSRQAILNKWRADAQLAAAERKDKKSYDAAVINSERPDLEIEG